MLCDDWDSQGVQLQGQLCLSLGNYPHALGRLQVGNLIIPLAPDLVNQEEEAASNALQANYFSGRNIENSLTIALLQLIVQLCPCG